MNKGVRNVLACYVIWGVLPIFWKQLAAVDSLMVLATRILWSLVFTAAVLTLSRQWSGVGAALRDKKEWLWLTAAGALIGMNWGMYIWAVNSGHMIDSSLAYYMMTPLTAVVGTLAFHEKLTKLQWIAAGLTVTGIVITAVRYGKIPWLALAIGGTFSLYSGVKKKVKADSNVSMFVETATLAPLALAYAVAAEMGGHGVSGVIHGAQWLLLPISGVVTTLPLMLFARGIKTTPLSLSGVLVYINPTLQLLLGVLLFDEKFTADHVILFSFVLTGLALFLFSGWREGRKAAEKESETCA